MFLAIALLIAVGATSSANAFDSRQYCDPKLCENTRDAHGLPYTHVACFSRAAPLDAGGSCPANARSVPLTPKQRQQILDGHNQLRSDVASGKVANFQPCSDMTEMKWNDELAYVASCNAGLCKFEHDGCRNTPDFCNSGQNIASVSQSDKQKDTDAAIDEMMQLWSAEASDCTPAIMASFSLGSGKPIGHFTQMAHANCSQMGCSMTEYQRPADHYYTKYLVCNYGETNMMHEPVCTAGATASACPGGAAVSQFGGLCAAEGGSGGTVVSSSSSSSSYGSVSRSSSSSSSTSVSTGSASRTPSKQAGRGTRSNVNTRSRPTGRTASVSTRTRTEHTPATIVTRRQTRTANGVVVETVTTRSVKQESLYTSSRYGGNRIGFGSDPFFDNSFPFSF